MVYLCQVSSAPSSHSLTLSYLLSLTQTSSPLTPPLPHSHLLSLTPPLPHSHLLSPHISSSPHSLPHTSSPSHTPLIPSHLLSLTYPSYPHTLPHALCHSHLSYSGYDFGYLIRVLTCLKLPDKEQNFFELLSVYFPKVYDVKYLMKSCKNLKGGLQEVADSLEVRQERERGGGTSVLSL